MQRLDILYAFFGMCFRVLEILKPLIGRSRGFYSLIIKPSLASVCVRVFGIGIQIPNSPNNNSVIGITGLTVMDNLVNVLKTKSLDCINLVLGVQNAEVTALIKNKQQQFVNGMHNLIPIVIQSLIIFGQRTDLEQLLEEDTISKFVIEMLELLCIATSIDEFGGIFFKSLHLLILDVGFNLIKTTENERLMMSEQPSEFVNLALDTCDKQKSRIVKT
jgi:hypothetical protein